MTDLEKIRNWLKGYPGTAPVRDLKVDYYSPNPDNGSIDPSGLIEVSRTVDITGDITVENQYNFALYFVLYMDWCMDCIHYNLYNCCPLFIISFVLFHRNGFCQISWFIHIKPFSNGYIVSE